MCYHVGIQLTMEYRDPMTTRQFINRAFTGMTRSKLCASVFQDDHHNLYSYGYHYPLLFRVGGLTFRNTSGYSNTTSRHVTWTRDVDAIDVELTGCNQYTWRNPENALRVPSLLYLTRYNDGTAGDAELEAKLLAAIKSDIQATIARLQAEMATKKRHDTSVYSWLQYRLDRATASLDALETVTV